jgi:tetratricopeptide (TPR) repeat protein
LLTMSNSYLLWDDAQKLLKGRTDLPGAKRIYYNRGSELIRIGSLREGMRDLKQAIAIDKDFVEAYVNLGAAYFKDGDWNNAINSWNKASEMYAGHGKNLQTFFIHQRAIAYEKTGEMSKALADYSLSCILENMGCDSVLRVHTSTPN